MPPRECSLYEHFRWRMDRAHKRRDVSDLLMLAGEARREHAGFIGNAEHDETEDQAVRRLLTEYEGEHCEYVAGRMSVGASHRGHHSMVRWVRRNRLENERDPTTGLPCEQDGLQAKVIALRKRGLKVRPIAEELGISKSRVSRLLGMK